MHRQRPSHTQVVSTQLPEHLGRTTVENTWFHPTLLDKTQSPHSFRAISLYLNCQVHRWRYTCALLINHFTVFLLLVLLPNLGQHPNLTHWIQELRTIQNTQYTGNSFRSIFFPTAVLPFCVTLLLVVFRTLVKDMVLFLAFSFGCSPWVALWND
jgi:hypothetical protein